jgi:hypothetical protein
VTRDERLAFKETQTRVIHREGTMRRAFLGLAMAGCALLAPSGLLAADQDVANQISANLRDSGKMHAYRVGVKVQNTTVWLEGSVANQEQLTTALNIVQDTPGIETIVNGLTVRDKTAAVKQAGGPDAGATAPATGTQADYDAPTPRSVVAQPRGTPMPLAASTAGYDTPNAPRVASHPHMAQPMPMPANMAPSAPSGGPIPAYVPAPGGGVAPAHFDHPAMPGYAWPSYASYPNYAAVTYPRQYSPTAWPFIGPFYPYPQVPLGWRKVTLEWHNGWWMLDFNDGCGSPY